MPRSSRARPGASPTSSPPRSPRSGSTEACCWRSSPTWRENEGSARETRYHARIESRVRLQIGLALGLEPVDHVAILLGPALPLIEADGLQQLDVVDTGNRCRHLVTEVGIGLPLDRSGDDSCDDGRAVRYPHLLAARIAITRRTHLTRVQEIHLEIGNRLQELQQAIPLPGVVVEEERIGAGHPEALSGLGRSPGRSSLGLAEHEVG